MDGGKCSDEESGDEIDCPVERGCNIKLGEGILEENFGHILILDKDLYTRGCSVEGGPGCTEGLVSWLIFLYCQK